MIPFASQRGLGQDLAAHLLNVSDNEYMELADLRGAIADDLQGAFAEWEAQAHALTHCKNYLYSLSVNPDQSQGRLSREQYFAYIDQVEERLGLSGQPRAVVFHIKDEREHAHVVWSRVDAVNEKAVHMAFDHQKLMSVTRDFAREHDIQLPGGYFKDKSADKSHQASQYDMAQKRVTGLSKQDHIDAVSDIWARADSPKAFVNGLAEKGYLLARGDRPYVVVNYYGGYHALPRLIGDKSVRAKDIRAFLEEEFAPESLPSVDEAKALIDEYRKSIESEIKAEHRAAQFERLNRSQDKRRTSLQSQAQSLRDKRRKETVRLDEKHTAARRELRAAYLTQIREIKRQRNENSPSGLAAFLGRVTGVDLIRKKLHKYQDKKRYETFRAQRDELRDSQQQERSELQRVHAIQGLAMQRRLNDFEKVVVKERASIEEMLQKEVRIRDRHGGKDMPSVSFVMTPRGRKAAPHKASRRHYKPATAKQASPEELQAQFDRAAEKNEREKAEKIALTKAFNDVSDDGKSDDGDSGSRSSGVAPKNKKQRTRKPRKERQRDDEEVQSYRRKRKRDNDLDRGR